MKAKSTLLGLAIVAMTLFLSETVQAQCNTCTQPALGYQAATYQVASPVVTVPVRTRWYPGKYLFGGWRNRGYAAQQTYAVGYAPYTPAYNSYTAAYAPAPYTASYAPVNYGYRPYTVGYGTYRVGYASAAPQTVGYRPYVTSYAPLTPACTTCAQTVARPVVVQPVAPSCNTCGYDPCSCNTCNTCNYTSSYDSCGSCSACTPSSVSSAVYSEPSCSSCTASTTVVQPSQPTVAPAQPGIGARTTQPQLNGPGSGNPYKANSPIENGDQPLTDPGPAEGTDSSTYYYEMKAPRLLTPSEDRTAQRPMSSRGPTVDVSNAVYSQRSTRQAHSVSYSPSQAEIDAQGWTAVPR